jgi:hypothetical protein
MDLTNHSWNLLAANAYKNAKAIVEDQSQPWSAKKMSAACTMLKLEHKYPGIAEHTERKEPK